MGFWAGLLPYGGWLLSGLMLAGWLTTGYTLHENQQVIRQLTAVRSTTAQHTGRLVDTVYIEKRTIVEHRYYADTRPDERGSNQREPGRVVQGAPQANRAIRRQSTSPSEKNSESNAPVPGLTPADSIDRAIAGATARLPADSARVVPGPVVSPNSGLAKGDSATQKPTVMPLSTSLAAPPFSPLPKNARRSGCRRCGPAWGSKRWQP